MCKWRDIGQPMRAEGPDGNVYDVIPELNRLEERCKGIDCFKLIAEEQTELADNLAGSVQALLEVIKTIQEEPFTGKPGMSRDIAKAEKNLAVYEVESEMRNS